MTDSFECWADQAVYLAYVNEDSDTNARELEHLRNCISISMRDDLTPTQRDYINLYLSGHNMLEIAALRNVRGSTVSRVVNRGLHNLFKHIRYATPATLRMTDKVHASLTRLYAKE